MFYVNRTAAIFQSRAIKMILVSDWPLTLRVGDSRTPAPESGHIHQLFLRSLEPDSQFRRSYTFRMTDANENDKIINFDFTSKFNDARLVDRSRLFSTRNKPASVVHRETGKNPFLDTYGTSELLISVSLSRNHKVRIMIFFIAINTVWMLLQMLFNMSLKAGRYRPRAFQSSQTTTDFSKFVPKSVTQGKALHPE